jgi:hypothetical protein
VVVAVGEEHHCSTPRNHGLALFPYPAMAHTVRLPKRQHTQALGTDLTPHYICSFIFRLIHAQRLKGGSGSRPIARQQTAHRTNTQKQSQSKALHQSRSDPFSSPEGRRLHFLTLTPMQQLH